jgi:hypothetical protein
MLYNGYGVPVVTGYNSSDKIVMSFNSVCTLVNPDADVKVISPDTKSADWAGLLDSILGNMCVSEGLPRNTFSATTESGIAKLIDGSEELQNLQKFRDAMQGTESKLCSYILGGECIINYGQIMPYMTRAEQLENYRNEISLGIRGVVETIASERGITPEQAKALAGEFVSEQAEASQAIGFS